MGDTAVKVPTGYKLTEVGVIPEDWDLSTIKEDFCIYGGVSASWKDLGTTGYCYLHYGDIHGATKYYIDLKKEYKYIPKYDLDINKINKVHLLKSGDVVFLDASEDVEGASKYVVIINDCNLSFIAGLHTIVAKSKNEKIDLYYKIYCFQNMLFRNNFNNYVAGTKVYGITKENIKKVFYSRPPLPEQIAIAEVLSDADNLIQAQEKLIQKKRDIKKATMQQLLTGRVRLPGFNEKWNKSKLGEVAAFLKGKQLSKNKISSTGKIPCIHYGELFTVYPEIINEIASYTNVSGNIVYSQKNDVLMPTSDVTPNGLAKASSIMLDKVIIGGDILIIKPKKDRVFGPFLSYHIRYSKNVVLRLVTGITVYHLYANDMKKYPLLLPNIKEQQAIAQVLSDMDSEISLLEKQLEKTRQVKLGMMQQLLTGRTRLIKPDRANQEVAL